MHWSSIHICGNEWMMRISWIFAVFLLIRVIRWQSVRFYRPIWYVLSSMLTALHRIWAISVEWLDLQYCVERTQALPGDDLYLQYNAPRFIYRSNLFSFHLNECCSLIEIVKTNDSSMPRAIWNKMYLTRPVLTCGQQLANIWLLFYSRQIRRHGKTIIYRVQDVRCTLKPYHLHLLAWHSRRPASKTYKNNR